MSQGNRVEIASSSNYQWRNEAIDLHFILSMQTQLPEFSMTVISIIHDLDTCYFYNMNVTWAFVENSLGEVRQCQRTGQYLFILKNEFQIQISKPICVYIYVYTYLVKTKYT